MAAEQQTLLSLAEPSRTTQVSEGRDLVAFWLMVVLLCLLPIQRLLLPFGLALADLVLVLLTVYGLLRAWVTHQRVKFPLLLPMWLILLSSSVATLLGLAPSDGFVVIVQEIYLFTWFIVLTNILRTQPLSDLDRLMRVWSVVACMEAVTTVMGMLRVGPSMFYMKPRFDATLVQDPYADAQFARAMGVHANANAAAVYLSVSFFALLATSWPIWLRAVLGVLLIAGIFGTGSNGALLPTIGGLLILAVVYSIFRNRRMILLWVAFVGLGMGVASIALLLPGLAPSLLPHSGQAAGGSLLLHNIGRISHSFGTRTDITAWAWEVYSRRPWGIGPNAFFSLQGSLHNDYLAFLFERGPVGLIGWVWIVGATLFTAWRAATRALSRQQCWQVLAMGAGFLACALNAFTHEVSHMRQVWVLMAFLFGLSYAVLAQSDAASANRADADGVRIWHDCNQAGTVSTAQPSS